jgi:hypothetical protein
MAALNFPAAPSVDDLYTANGSTWKWDGTSWNVVPANVLLANLGDVSVGGVTDGQALVYNATSGDWESSTPVSALDSLTDVTITSATTGDLLQYDGTDWVNTVGDLNTTATVQGSDATSDWTQATGSDPWIATLTVSGILSTDRPIVDVDLSSVAFADVTAAQTGWSLVYRAEASADNQIKLYATAEPAPTFALLITVVR